MNKTKSFNINIFADGADMNEMLNTYENGNVTGFTTNPSLLKKAGVSDYETFARKVISNFPELPISFEVLSDDFNLMEREALKIAEWGENVYVKIPISNADGKSSIPLIKSLSSQGVQLNVTAILTISQVQQTVDVLKEDTKNIVSVFAGRIADTGVDPLPIMKEATKICHQKKVVEILWASCRELLNIFQAESCGCDIITCQPDILSKLPNVGKDLELISLETVQQFSRDSKDLGFSLVK